MLLILRFWFRDARILVIVIVEKNYYIMSQYQRIEYLIGKDGKIVERAIGIVGSECVAVTAEIEAKLGKVENRELLSSYYETSEQILDLNVSEQTQYD